MSLDAIVKDATCDFSDTSTLTLAEKLLLQRVFAKPRIVKSDFVSDWGRSQWDTLHLMIAF